MKLIFHNYKDWSELKLSNGLEPAFPGNPARSSRDDGGVGERPSPGHAASLVPVDPGVVLLDLCLWGARKDI